MAIALRDDVYFCLTDRSVIFLDLAANRYFGLAASSEIAIRRIIAGDQLDNDLRARLAPALARRLLVETSRAKALVPVAIEHPTDCLPDVRYSFRVATVLRAIRARLSLAIELRVRGLNAVVAARRRRKDRASNGSRRANRRSINAIVAAHQWIDGIIGGNDRCLARSLALIDHLFSEHHYPDMVIGVRTGGFAAHCWVQSGVTVLNDDVDRVSTFTPIMVL